MSKSLVSVLVFLIVSLEETETSQTSVKAKDSSSSDPAAVSIKKTWSSDPLLALPSFLCCQIRFFLLFYLHENHRNLLQSSLWLYLMCLCLSYICSSPISVFSRGCLNRRNVFCLHSQQVFFLYLWKQPYCLWWKEPVCLFFSFLFSAPLLKSSGRGQDHCYSAESTAGSHWKTQNASSLCRPPL